MCKSLWRELCCWICTSELGRDMIFDFEQLNDNKKYSLMSNTIFPRPIAWISTEDEGVINLAPYSYFAPISTNPPCVIVAVGHKEDGTPKDTNLNIIKHGRCTINFAHKGQLQVMANTAEPLPHEISEAEEFGIETNVIFDEFPPMVADSHVALFCEYRQTLEISDKYKPLILEIKQLYVSDEYIDEKGHITLDNIGRVGIEYLINSERVKVK